MKDDKTYIAKIKPLEHIGSSVDVEQFIVQNDPKVEEHVKKEMEFKVSQLIFEQLKQYESFNIFTKVGKIKKEFINNNNNCATIKYSLYAVLYKVENIWEE